MVKNAVKILGVAGALGLFFLIRKQNKKPGSMDNNKLSKNFNWSEFESNDGAPMPPEVAANVKELAKNLEVIRDTVGKPVKINSGYRSPAWNKKVGGVSGSQHQLGKAADIVISGMTAAQVHAVVLDLIKQGKIKPGGVGKYGTFVHYDIRGTNARWNG